MPVSLVSRRPFDNSGKRFAGYGRQVMLLWVVASLSLPNCGLAQYSIDWIGQFGTSQHDGFTATAVSPIGNLYVGGYTFGAIGGPQRGQGDALLVGIDSSTGSVLWKSQFGTDFADFVLGVSADADGNAYAIGGTDGNLGGTNAGFTDAFVAKFDQKGEMEWLRQFGTAGRETVWDGTADANGNTYTAITLTTISDQSLVLVKHDMNGELVWTHEYGTPFYEEARSVAVDAAGNILLTGYTEGLLGSQSFGYMDAYLSKFSASGELLWTRQFGSTFDDYAFGVATDRFGNSFVVGETRGDFAAPNGGFNDRDVFVAKFGGDGNMQWARQFGTIGYEGAIGAGTDAQGSVYITGRSDFNLFESWAGFADTFVAKLDSDGDLEWGMQVGTSVNDLPYWHSAVDPSGVVYVPGVTQGSLGGPNAGGLDAFVMRIRDVPEPTGIVLYGPWIWMMLAIARRGIA